MDYINIELIEGFTINTVSYELASEQGADVVPTYQKYFDNLKNAQAYYQQLTNK